MSYANGQGDEYIGTGWLIDNDLVATAGHCVFDWKAKGAFLKYIKCYFGYDGIRSPGLYRYGVAAACPAEYLKAESDVHDVGFVSTSD
jgi:V8-like Glu-specific endopeptidase